MNNFWVNKYNLKKFPILARVRVSGPLRPDAILQFQFDYTGELGVVIDHNIDGGWVGVLLDLHMKHTGNNVSWFHYSEIQNEDEEIQGEAC